MKRWLFAAVAVVLLAALYVPRISADAYRDRAKTALEKALGRTVEIGSVRFRLLPTPAITISDVIISEDPQIGPEPTAYVKTLQATPRFTALFGGPLEFASVELEDASVNLTRVLTQGDNGPNDFRWNFAALLQPQLLAAFPRVHMRGGRINFKFGDAKSLFYLSNTDVDLWPPGSAKDPWTLRVHAEPARTDRRARGFGSFVMRGQWQQTDGATTLDVKLEQSELGDMLTLFNGYESGLAGHISGDAHLAGPLNRLGVAGRMKVSNVHGWNQTPGGNEWNFAIGGAIDAPGQVIDLSASTRVSRTQTPLQLHYRVADYLRRPRWAVTANLNRFPLAPIPDIARNLGWVIPADFKFDGTADGAVGFSLPDRAPRMDGALNVSNATLIVAGAPPLHLPGATLRFSGSAIKLEATEIRNESNETAAIQGDWDVASQKFDVELSSDGMALASLRRQVSVAGIPLLGNATSGTWKGRSAIQHRFGLGGRDQPGERRYSIRGIRRAAACDFGRCHDRSGRARDEAHQSFPRRYCRAGGISLPDGRSPPAPVPYYGGRGQRSRDRKAFDARVAARQSADLRVQLRPRTRAGLAAQHACRRNDPGRDVRSGGRAVHKASRPRDLGGYER